LNKAFTGGLRPNFYYCQTVTGFLMWGALSDERTDLPFTVAAGRRQRSHSRVRVPWDSQPYFTISDSRLPFSSQKQKLTAGNQPARSYLASGPAGTHGHIFVQCQDLCFFFSLILHIDKGGVGLFYIYRLVFTYYILLHLRLLFSPPKVLVEYIYI
jgi:hypothetical protein